jgi:hypothetical protein
VGLMDKFKEQASQLAEKTQEAARDGKVRFDQAQAMRRADAMLRNLGALVYAERTGRAAPDTQAQQERLISDISAHEAQNGINLAPDAAASATGSSEAAPGYPPPQESPSTFPPQESSTFPPSESSTFPPSESQGFPPSDATGFPPSDPPGFPPSGGTTQV